MQLQCESVCRLHRIDLAEGEPHAGMNLARQQRYSVGEQMRRFLELIVPWSAEKMENRNECLSAWD